MHRPQSVARWSGSVAAIAMGLAWLHLLGAGDLGGPPLSVHGAASWLENRDAAAAAFALVRLVALVFGWYLLLIAALGGAARLLRLPRLSSVAERLTFPFARGMVGGMALLGVMAGPPPVQPPTPDSMIELDEHATLHLLPDDSAVPTPAPASVPAATPSPEQVPPATPSPEPVPPAIQAASNPDAWVVQPGESFWSIAAEHLADVNGRPVSEREVDSYWREVVELNRSRLVVPSDADLLFVGQAIELPATASD
jgi:hypothetical protein